MSEDPGQKTIPSPEDEQADVRAYYGIHYDVWWVLTDKARNALTAQMYHGPLVHDFVWRTYE